ncbi:SIMPL domain-containing protein [Patescibacteria group bacterium]|nr:SIMPL domain-containing protein [Patescibacteria group bacterium]MBU1663595.1 SIMPL domain-containing protein [Patescibacteria group bacterium]MBU1934073.1 SIMPL domain-containing protein [Patescibacteria group bacterium]MBU2007867.1 SIMPL domain-containing protein [Patescibacteria group bacterium]MBU2233626.1 SIMPL domain-containing protein [Patescibacteria group bacterium]
MIPNKIVTIFVSIMLVVSAVYLGILSWNAIKTHNYIGINPRENYFISITGEGKVTGVPDVAKIQLGYSVEKKTVADAQKENTAKMNAIIDKLKKDFKIDSQDIKTVNYSISPQYEWAPSGKQTLRGYLVSQDLTVKVREMNKISQVLDVAGAIGINQVGNLFFEIDKPEKLKEEARAKALEQAKSKAEALSDIVGVKLGKIISFSESSSDGAPMPMYSLNKMDESIGGGGAAQSVEAGSNEITVYATVQYEIF